jgi:hypothetical protein
MRLTRMTKGLTAAALVVGLTFAFVGPAFAAGHREATGRVRSMVPFSSLSWSPRTEPTTHRSIGRMQLFSDMNAFGPIPRVVPVTVTSVTQAPSHSWSTDWRTIVLTIVAGLLAISLAVVGAGYIRTRRLAV